MKAHDVVDAIFESGVFKPAEPVSLEEGQRVRLSIEPVNGAPPGTGHEELRRWTEVFEGLTDDDVSEIDRIISDRSHFIPDRNGSANKK